MKASEAYQMGKDRGYAIATWQDMPEIGTKIGTFDCEAFVGVIKSVSDAEEVFLSYCSQAETNDREYSPFEFTASDFNKAKNSERLWDNFDLGITDGFQECWNKRSVKFYSEELVPA